MHPRKMGGHPGRGFICMGWGEAQLRLAGLMINSKVPGDRKVEGLSSLLIHPTLQPEKGRAGSPTGQLLRRWEVLYRCGDPWKVMTPRRWPDSRESETTTISRKYSPDCQVDGQPRMGQQRGHPSNQCCRTHRTPEPPRPASRATSTATTT